MTREKTLARIAGSGIIAIIRAATAERAADIARALLAGGIDTLEITLTTAGAVAAIGRLTELFGAQICLGAGTVLDAASCREALAAGSQFIVSPTLEPSVIEATRAAGAVSIPGAYTPTEILTAHRAGADVVKVFPAGGLRPAYFSDVLAPLPFLRLAPTGGVDATTAGAWIAAGAYALGAGSSLVPRAAVESQRWDEITARARQLVAAVRAARTTQLKS